MNCIEQLESRTLLSSTPWGEVVYDGPLNQVELLSNGDMLVVASGSFDGVAVSGISRLSPDGTVIWQRDSELALGSASVAISGDTEVIWLSAAEGVESRLIKVSPDGEFQVFGQPVGYRKASLPDGRLAFIAGQADQQLRFVESDGDLEQTTVDLELFREVRGIDSDAEGNVYVVGYSSEPKPAVGDLQDDLRLFDGIIQKYDPTGNLLWQRRYDVGDSNIFGAVDVDEAGNAWVAAELEPQGRITPFPPGGAPDSGPAYIRAICYGPDGALVVSPIVYAATSSDVEYHTLSISATDGLAVLGLMDARNATGILIGVEGDEIRWKSASGDGPLVDHALAPDGKLLTALSGSTGPLLIRVDQYRQGDTFFVPGSDLDDVITVEVKGERIVARRGDDRIITFTEGLNEISVGLAQGNDSLTAAVPFNVDARGGLGDDTIITGHGQDTLYGGDGNDRIESRGSADSVFGGRGRDTLLGGAGDDSMAGGGGMDLIQGEGGNDSLAGEGGNDTLYSGEGDGADSLVGGADDDTLTAFGEGSTVRGGLGNDSINVGWIGRATVYGGRGADDITTGGADQVFGGPDADFFTSVYPDVIKDLEPGEGVRVPTTSQS